MYILLAYICTKFKITSDVIDDVKEKINRLSAPRGFGIMPVLVYMGDLSEKISDSDFFYKIIDLSKNIDSLTP